MQLYPPNDVFCEEGDNAFSPNMLLPQVSGNVCYRTDKSCTQAPVGILYAICRGNVRRWQVFSLLLLKKQDISIEDLFQMSCAQP